MTRQKGRGVTDDLVKIAGPVVIRELSKGVAEVKKGVPTTKALGQSMDRFSRDLKRKAPAIAVGLAKGAVKRKASPPIKSLPRESELSKTFFHNGQTWRVFENRKQTTQTTCHGSVQITLPKR